MFANKLRKLSTIIALSVFTINVSLTNSPAQEMPPEPTASRAVSIPKITESKLPNGLRVIVVERRSVPLVNVSLIVNSGAGNEDESLAGLADMTAAMMSKGTLTRSATQISEQMEFLGSEINAGANWNSTNISFNATSDKLNQAMAIFADVVLHPTFPAKEIALYKSQTLDELKQRLAQPGFLSNAVASRYTFDEHFAFGTPETIKSITRLNLMSAHKAFFLPKNSTLILAGDISEAQANAAAKRFFGVWSNPPEKRGSKNVYALPALGATASLNSLVLRMLVVDVPNSGQASVSYAKRLSHGRLSGYSEVFPASVANGILGGGYSARLNQEIRIKRGLSYGAASSFAWRKVNANFSTRCQTKNESAAEVAELTIDALEKLSKEVAIESELIARKAVLTGTFGRNFETNFGVSNQISDLITFGLPMSDLNSYMSNTESVSAGQVRDFASKNFRGGDIIIVGDYAMFKDDLAKRFPKMNIEMIKSSELDLNRDSLRKK